MSVTARIGAAYSASARAWAAGPARIYGRLATALVDRSPVALDGRLALDVGSGTGAATLALRARGARVVALDAAVGMIASGPAPGGRRRRAAAALPRSGPRRRSCGVLPQPRRPARGGHA